MRIVISVCGGLIALAAIIVLGYIVIKELFFTPGKKQFKNKISAYFLLRPVFFSLFCWCFGLPQS